MDINGNEGSDKIAKNATNKKKIMIFWAVKGKGKKIIKKTNDEKMARKMGGGQQREIILQSSEIHKCS